MTLAEQIYIPLLQRHGITRASSVADIVRVVWPLTGGMAKRYRHAQYRTAIRIASTLCSRSLPCGYSRSE